VRRISWHGSEKFFAASADRTVLRRQTVTRPSAKHFLNLCNL
jgi:hypothetical protein